MSEIFKSHDILKMPFIFSKGEARELLRKNAKFWDAKFLDRFNLEEVLNRFMHSKVSVTPDPNDMRRGIKVGWAFKACLPHPKIGSNVTSNLLEIPLLKEFLARGCEIHNIGRSTNSFEAFAPKMFDYSAEWRKLPPSYRPVPDWILHCVNECEDTYGMELPDVDFVIMNAFPSFFPDNMMFYVLNILYANRGIPVFLWDYEFRTLKAKEKDTTTKVFHFSGADKEFSDEDFLSIANNAHWLVQIPGMAVTKIRKLNPKISVVPFLPPYWLRKDIGMYSVGKKVMYRTAYVGNDSERRNTIKKYFSPLSEKNRLNLFGGGMSKRTKGYEGFAKNAGTIIMNEGIPQEEVWRTYNISRTCLSVARQRYYDSGHIVHRWLEVVLAGCILLLPRELHGVEKYFDSNFLVDDLASFEAKISFYNDKASLRTLKVANMIQKKFIYQMFSSERGVDTIFRTVGI